MTDANAARRATALETVLIDAAVEAESGLVWRTFDNAGRDADDFANIGRGELQRLLTAAYEAGKADA